MGTLRLIGYVRVSTEGQADSGLSLADQKKKIEGYCELYSERVELVSIVSDAGISAKNMRRPGLQEVLERLDADEADGVIVANFDRLTRNVYDMGFLLDHYFSGRFEFIDIHHQMDTSTATGRCMMNIMLTFSQFERERAGERTAAALAEKRSRGEYTGGPIPYGYALDETGDYLVENPVEQKAMRTAKALRQTGESLRSISRALAAQGFTNRKGTAIHPNQIKRLVS